MPDAKTGKQWTMRTQWPIIMPKYGDYFDRNCEMRDFHCLREFCFSRVYVRVISYFIKVELCFYGGFIGNLIFYKSMLNG